MLNVKYIKKFVIPFAWTKYSVTKRKFFDRQKFPLGLNRESDKYTTKGDINKKNKATIAKDILSTFRLLFSRLLK